jgi:hypothetical protein
MRNFDQYLIEELKNPTEAAAHGYFTILTFLNLV